MLITSQMVKTSLTQLEKWLFLSLIIGVGMPVLGHSKETSVPITPSIEQKNVPNWVKTDTDGSEVSLYAELEKGNTVIMVFWASWCRFCKVLLPELHDFNQQLANRPVKIIAMNIWEDGNPILFLKKKQLQLRTILNSEVVANRFGIKSTPGVVVVGSNKKILYQRQLGQKPKHIMEEIRRVIPL